MTHKDRDTIKGLAELVEDWRSQRMPEAVYWVERSFYRRRLRMKLAASCVMLLLPNRLIGR